MVSTSLNIHYVLTPLFCCFLNILNVGRFLKIRKVQIFQKDFIQSHSWTRDLRKVIFFKFFGKNETFLTIERPGFEHHVSMVAHFWNIQRPRFGGVMSRYRTTPNFCDAESQMLSLYPASPRSSAAGTIFTRSKFKIPSFSSNTKLGMHSGSKLWKYDPRKGYDSLRIKLDGPSMFAEAQWTFSFKTASTYLKKYFSKT